MSKKLANNKDARRIITVLRGRGWRIEHRGGNVLAFDPSGNYRPLIIGKMKDHRTRHNMFSEIKRRDPELDTTLLS